MISNPVREAQWLQLSELIAEKIGLHFPQERQEDLKRAFAGAVREFGFEDSATCIDWLISGPSTKAQLQVLANHLTIGETYFFRDKPALEAFADEILPGLIRAQRGRGKRLRIWSAACCSGEEAYSLAILLHQALPDLQDWQVTIMATDINALFLQKAVTGIYGEWSFRNSPAWLKKRYFNRTEDGRFAIVPEIKRLVTFAHLNLVEDAYPSLTTNTNAMDVIFCRNVLMYFSPAQVGKVISNLSCSLVEGGWLAVSPSEASKALFPQFNNVNFPGAILFQKKDALLRTEPIQAIPFSLPEINDELPVFSGDEYLQAVVPVEDSNSIPTQHEASLGMSALEDPLTSAELLYQQGYYAEVVDLLTAFVAHPIKRSFDPAAFSLLARALANQGKLSDALLWCDRWIDADKMNASSHYLRAIVMLELGDHEPARSSLQRAIYLQPDFVLAHFTLGNLARDRNKMDEAAKHFSNTLRLLASCQPDHLLPESDGLTAGRLVEFITSMTVAEGVL